MPALRDEVRAYIDEAFDDARRRLRRGFDDQLSPFNDAAVDPAANYPHALHRVTLQGYFGETLAAMAVEHLEDRLTFVGDVLALIAQVPSFGISRKLGTTKNSDAWRDVLRWWLAKQTLARQPTARQVADWYDFAAQNFIYRGAWRLGSVLSLLLDIQDGGQPIAALGIDDWSRSGLPWIAFWLKELLTWGTSIPGLPT